MILIVLLSSSVVMISNVLLTAFPSLLIHPIIAKTPILIFIFLLSFIIMNAFTSIYSTAIDTLLLCYCEEREYTAHKEVTFEEFARKSVEDVKSNIEIHVIKTKKTKEKEKK